MLYQVKQAVLRHRSSEARIEGSDDMLNALSVVRDGGSEGGQRCASDSMKRQGFLHALRFAWDGGVLDAWSHPSQHDVENLHVQTPQGAACCVGPVWYRGRFGSAALGLLLGDLNTAQPIDEKALHGNFALFLRTPNRCLLMNDALGFVRLYTSPDGCFYSTSWLATCAYAGGMEVDEFAATEYVLLGASHSDQTVARGIKSLPRAHAVDLATGHLHVRRLADTWDETTVHATFDSAVDDIRGHLETVSREVGAAFPGRTRAALSGGFDSRLIVAGQLACGNRPELFVYGDHTCDDISIARRVAKRADLPLQVIDKAAQSPSASLPDLDLLVRNAVFFDGLPNDGIYDSGVDRQTRLAQTARGYMVLNGGGGEIFRNFFHLPDRPLHASDVVRAFYRGFDAKVFRRADGLSGYRDTLVASIRRVLGLRDQALGQLLTRQQIELIYPLFRCHYWMSVNNSVATRHGYYVTPLIDLTTVGTSWRLPLAWKNAGRLESRLIAKLHMPIASEPSTYGFRFSDGPGWQAQYSERAMCARPVFLRPFINGVRRRVHKQVVASDMIAHSRALLPGEWRLDPLLDLDRLPDNAAFGRALAIEVVWRGLLG